MNRRTFSSPTMITLVALGAGMGLGLLVFRSGSARWLSVAEHIASLGTLWTNALRLTVIPLIVSTLIVAVAGGGAANTIGRIAGLSFATFAGLLTVGVVVIVTVVPVVLPRLNLEKRAVLQEAVNAQELRSARADSLTEVIATLLPPNLVKAAAEDDLLPLVVFSIFVGLAATRIEPERKAPFMAVVGGLAVSMRVLIGWILWLMPIAIFAFSFVATAKIGLSTVGILGSWVAIAFLNGRDSYDGTLPSCSSGREGEPSKLCQITLVSSGSWDRNPVLPGSIARASRWRPHSPQPERCSKQRHASARRFELQAQSDNQQRRPSALPRLRLQCATRSDVDHDVFNCSHAHEFLVTRDTRKRAGRDLAAIPCHRNSDGRNRPLARRRVDYRLRYDNTQCDR